MTHATPRFESGFSPILQAVAAMGPGPLTERGLISHIHPLFSRVLERREIYLANHSLGRPLDQTAIDVRSALDCWYADMDGAWGLWLDEQSRFRAGIARLIGLFRFQRIAIISIFMRVIFSRISNIRHHLNQLYRDTKY